MKTEAARVRGISLRPVPEIRESTRMQAEVDGIRDLVTISSWGAARTSTRFVTYDRYGNLSTIGSSAEPVEPAIASRSARCEVAFVLVPYPVPVMRYVNPETDGGLEWPSTRALPEPI